jgi:hypothetical protein
MKAPKDFVIEIDRIAESETPDVDFREDYKMILRAEGFYQVKRLIESNQYSENDILNIIRFGILKIPSTIKFYKKEESSIPIHPYRYDGWKAPLMIKNKDGSIEWIKYENKFIAKEGFCLMNICEYAYKKILSVRKSEKDLNIFNWLLTEVEKFQRQAKRSIIKNADPKDLLLFSIDSAAAAIDNNELITDFFSVNRYLERGIELYADKYNLLRGTETI